MRRKVFIFVTALFFLSGCASNRNVHHRKKHKPHGCNCSKWSYNPKNENDRIPIGSYRPEEYCFM